MLIRELKSYTWYYDNQLWLVLSSTETKDKLQILNKTQMFSLQRFLIRVSQNLSQK